MNVDELRGDRTDLLVTVASLYYELNQNQQQIADRLEISRSSVSRMIKEARDLGIVEIRIHKPINRDFYLEQALIERFGLQDAYVLGTSPEMREDEALYGVGRLAAGYLQRTIGGMSPVLAGFVKDMTQADAVAFAVAWSQVIQPVNDAIRAQGVTRDMIRDHIRAVAEADAQAEAEANAKTEDAA